MSVAGNSSLSNHFPSNGRKRKLSPQSNDKAQTKLKFPTEKRARFSQEVPEISQPSENMAHLPADTNNKFPHVNSIATKAGLNNHAKKPGQSKKLVIKNRRGVS